MSTKATAPPLFLVTACTAAYLLSAILLPGQVTSTNPSDDFEVLSETPAGVPYRDRVSSTWTRTVVLRNRRTGKVSTERRNYVQVASGLNFRRGNGQFQETREEFSPARNGSFVAERGPYQLSLGGNLDALPAVELT